MLLLTMSGTTLGGPGSGPGRSSPYLGLQRAGARAPVVRSENLLGGESRWLNALRSGLPVRLHYRVEIWRLGEGWFDTLRPTGGVGRRGASRAPARPIHPAYAGRGLGGRLADTPRSTRSVPRSPLPTRSMSGRTIRAVTTTPPRSRSPPCRIPTSTSWSVSCRRSGRRGTRGQGNWVTRWAGGATRFLLRLAGLPSSRLEARSLLALSEVGAAGRGRTPLIRGSRLVAAKSFPPAPVAPGHHRTA